MGLFSDTKGAPPHLSLEYSALEHVPANVDTAPDIEIVRMQLFPESTTSKAEPSIVMARLCGELNLAFDPVPSLHPMYRWFGGEPANSETFPLVLLKALTPLFPLSAM